MDFVFRKVEQLSQTELTQGDLIARTPSVVDRVGQAHQYYATANDYTHFMVLTQSCDLVMRRGHFKAPYITIAAVRPLRNSIDAYLTDLLKPIDKSDFHYRPISAVASIKQLLERHINNTESEFFFLPQSGHPNISEDLVVYLRLSIALRKEHYETLAQSKIAELDDVFQAKLGWLKGNIYSRVATPDLDDRGLDSKTIKGEFYNNYIPSNEAVWLSGLQAQLLKGIVKQRSAAIGRELTSAEVIDLIQNEIPNDVEIIANKIVDRLCRAKLVDPNDAALRKDFISAIADEATLKSIVGSGKGVD